MKSLFRILTTLALVASAIAATCIHYDPHFGGWNSDLGTFLVGWTLGFSVAALAAISLLPAKRKETGDE